MGLNDIILTPIFLIIFSLAAFWVRKYVSTPDTVKYFLPALFFKFFAAIFIGLLYQFYYRGGDTFNYFYHGGIIWNAFGDSFQRGMILLFRLGTAPTLAFEYFEKMYWFYDPPSYFICQVTAFFDLFTGHTYSSTALFFALFSFSGSWKLFNTLNFLYPGNTKKLAITFLFIPSVVVWGSGILKDTISYGALLWLFAALVSVNSGRRSISNYVIILIASWILYKVKVYILIVLIPAILIWILFSRLESFKNRVVKIALFPIMLSLVLGASYYASVNLVAEDSKYSLNRIAQTTQITSYDIGFYTGAGAGSSYSLGALDGTFASMISKAPLSISTSLFRPFIWEVRNPLMLLSCLEGASLFIISFYSLRKGLIFRNLRDPFLLSCFIFSIVFAFSVGFSYNFGTLVRYRIPMIAFYLIPLIIKK